MNHYSSNIPIKVLTPMEWIKTPITQPAYYGYLDLQL